MMAATTKRLLVHPYSLPHLCPATYRPSGKDHITYQSIIGETDTSRPFPISSKEIQVKNRNFVGEKLTSLGINRAYIVSYRELHSHTRQDLIASKAMTDHLLQNTATRKSQLTGHFIQNQLPRVSSFKFTSLVEKDKLMADNSDLVEELKSLLIDVDGNKTLMARNLGHIKKLDCKNEELMANNLEQVKKLDFTLGLNLLDEYVARNLEIARNLDPSKINGNDDLMAIIKELFTRLSYAFMKVEKNYELMPDYMELVKELNCVSEKIDANDEDNLALVNRFGLALWKINSNNKLMIFNLELVKILEFILEKSDADDKLMASMEPYSSQNVNKGLMVKNLEILRELDFGFEKINVINDKWMADNLELIRTLEFIVGKINANDQLIKENLEIVKLCHDQNDELKADNLDKVRKSIVSVAKITENEAWSADIRKSQVDLTKINTSDLLVVGYSELVKMLVRPRWMW